MDLAPFRPDQGELLSGTPTNTFMLGEGYYGPRPTLSTAPGATALDAACRGAYGGYLPNGTFKGFLATSSKVKLLASDFTQSNLTTAFTVPTDDDECFSQFGVFMLCSNTTDGLYAYNMDTPAGLNAVSGAPAARVLWTANNMVIAGGAGSSALNRLQTSAFGDHTNWTTKGASKQDLNDGGAITGGGDLGNGRSVILQQRAVRLMTFGQAGGGALFRIDKLADDVGSVHPRSQVTYNGKTWFLHTNGFWETDGQSVVNIGAGKVNQWFLARCPDLKKVYAAVDPRNTIVRWRYKASGVASDSIFQDILDYNWVTKEFIPGTEQTGFLFRFGTPGYTLATLGALGGLTAWATYPIGSAVWKGGNLRLAGLDSNLKTAFWDGASAAATIETATEADGTSYMVTSAEPLTDDSASTISLGVKDRLTNTTTWKTAASMQTSGRVPLMGRGKYMRLRLNHAAGATWTGDRGIANVIKRGAGPI